MLGRDVSHLCSSISQAHASKVHFCIFICVWWEIVGIAVLYEGWFISAIWAMIIHLKPLLDKSVPTVTLPVAILHALSQDVQPRRSIWLVQQCPIRDIKYYILFVTSKEASRYENLPPSTPSTPSIRLFPCSSCRNSLHLPWSFYLFLLSLCNPQHIFYTPYHALFSSRAVPFKGSI